MTFEPYPPASAIGGDHAFFDTVAEMQSGALANGDQCHTAGYSAVGDGGGSADGYTYHDAGQSGETEDGGFVIFGTAGDDYFTANNQETAHIAQFGAKGNDDGSGTTGQDDAPFIQAALDSGAKYCRSAWDNKNYRILKAPVLWSTHDGMIVDFGNDWLMPDPELHVTNDAFQVISGGDQDQNPIAHTEFKITIRRLNINGNWDYEGFRTAVITEFNVLSTNDTVEIDAVDQQANIDAEHTDAVYGTKRFNGLNFIMVVGGTDKTEAFFKDCSVDYLHCKNLAKSALFISDPENFTVGTVIGEGIAVHPIVTTWDGLEANVQDGQGSLVIRELFADGASTAFDFAGSAGVDVPSVGEDTYPQAKIPTVYVDSVSASRIYSRTKAHGAWNLRIDSAIFKNPDTGNKYSAVDMASRLPRRVDIGSLEVDGYVSAYTSPPTPTPLSTTKCITNIGTLICTRQDMLAYLGNESRVVFTVAPHKTVIGALVTEDCALIIRGDTSVGHIDCRVNIDKPEHWSASTTRYAFDMEGNASIGGGVIHDLGFGSLIPTYLCFLRSAGCSIKNVQYTSSVTDGTLIAWPAVTPVTIGDIVYEQQSPAHIPGMWQSDSTRTTGATFDATEETFWTKLSGVNGGDGRPRRLAFITNNSFDGQLEVRQCNLEGIWERDFTWDDVTKHSINASDLSNNQSTQLPDIPPVAGTYKMPTIIYYGSPAAAGKIGAVLTAAGTPGTWKEFGAIDP